ncbi:tyrosine-type recombinase/integrase [uncultured Phocaeicola sp.]|uniref:tyrosine-type recombinase/integrase n=1 Tax=uncultured Phocaeicola sp. TaxID=990718 RepID=UPI00258538BE|nr:tyrosine-type recombinase/integrase [uncultured Phocaeicola sp.]
MCFVFIFYISRHTWASIARENGVSLSVISEGMGHTSEKTTRIYLASLNQVIMDEANRKVLSSIK